ncbi:MAG: 2-C-methyl-D-erythritol 4-phosphate cytidylyltransferase [Acidimicrobiales bacterium]
MPSVVWTIVVAAGAGQRFGRPKQFEMLGDRRVVDWSVDVARAASDGVVVVLPPGHGGVEGGTTRSESVRNGLARVPDGADIVCVHDAARPFASSTLFTRVIAAVEEGADAAIPAVAVADTIKEIDTDGVVVRTPPRDRLVAVQTPQAFRAASLRTAHENGGDATDDAALVEAIGGRVVVVEGDPENRKLTVPDDLEWARRRVAS